MRAVLMTASQLAFYDGFKNLLLSKITLKDDLTIHFSASFLAGFVITIICSLVDVIKRRVMSIKESEELTQLLIRMYRIEGVN